LSGLFNVFLQFGEFALEVQYQLTQVALAHKIKQANSQQQQKAPLRQAISEYQPAWQGLLPQKQKNKHNKNNNQTPAFDVAVDLCSIFCERRATMNKH